MITYMEQKLLIPCGNKCRPCHKGVTVSFPAMTWELMCRMVKSDLADLASYSLDVPQFCSLDGHLMRLSASDYSFMFPSHALGLLFPKVVAILHSHTQ